MDFQQTSQPNTVVRADSLLAEHAVLRNTYFLLSLTLLFSAVCAYFSMQANIRVPFLLQLGGMFGFLFLTQALRNSAWGILTTFAFTGFTGLMLGPMLNAVIHGFSNGGQLVMTSLGATGVIFLTLSGYVLTSRKDFSFMGGMLFAALVVGIIASFATLFFHMPMAHIMLSGVFVLVFSGFILYDTSRIINGGETNYIMATISLYLAIFNLFVNLLQILSFLAGNRD